MPDLPQLLDSVDEKLEELGRRNAYRELLFSFITGIDIQRNSTLLMAYRSLHWEGGNKEYGYGYGVRGLGLQHGSI